MQKYALSGLGFIMGWLWTLFLNGPIIYRLSFTNEQTEKLLWLFLLFNSLSFLATALLVKGASRLRYGRQIPDMAAILMTVFTLLLGFNPIQEWLIVLICAGAGLGSAILICAFGQIYSCYNSRQAALYFCLAILIGSFFYLPAIYFPAKIALYISAAIPLVALFCYRISIKNPRDESSQPAKEEYCKANRVPLTGQTIGLILVYYLVGGLMFKVVNLLHTTDSQQLFLISNFVYCIISLLLVGLILFYRSSPNLTQLYRPVLALLGTAFLLLPFLKSSWLIVYFTLFQIGFALFDLYIWLLLSNISRRRHGMQVYGWGFFLITGSMMLASLIYQLILPGIAQNSGRINTLSILAAILMLAAAVIFQTKELLPNSPLPVAAATDTFPIGAMADTNMSSDDYKGELRQEKSSAHTDYQENQPTRRARELVERYKLTKREGEVLFLLVRGYNNPYICDQLNISVNTLKTHLRNIYRKAEVNDRQELIRMIYN